MAHMRVLPGGGNGFDKERSLLVVSAGKTGTVYLIAGSDLIVYVSPGNGVATVDELPKNKIPTAEKSQLTAWEKQQDIRRFTVKGVTPGATKLVGRKPDGRNWIKPLDVRVVVNADYCQAAVGDDATPELRIELAALDLREAAIRVAEDHMNSRIGRDAHGGKGRYTIGKYDWCGAFAHFCYDKAAAIKGTTNPFGTDRDVLLSPEKAITWVTFNQYKAMLIGYEGEGILVPDVERKLRKKAIEEAAAEKTAPFPINTTFAMNDNFGLVERGDICLVREETRNWKHVAIVYERFRWGETFKTIDGNQGSPSIQIRDRAQKKFHFGPQYVFVHLTAI